MTYGKETNWNRTKKMRSDAMFLKTSARFSASEGRGPGTVGTTGRGGTAAGAAPAPYSRVGSPRRFSRNLKVVCSSFQGTGIK